MNNIYLRPVEWAYMDLLYEWANDKHVRKNSFNSATIPYNDHKHWFENCMTDNNTVMYILCDNESKIGQIRLDCNQSVATINYSISKENRGLGYGKIIIQLVEKNIVIDKPHITCIKAFVKRDNIASQKVFEDNGYKGTYDEREKHYLYSKEIAETSREININSKKTRE